MPYPTRDEAYARGVQDARLMPSPATASAERYPDPLDIAPASARKVSWAYRSEIARNGTFDLVLCVSWKSRDGDWDGEFVVVETGLSEAGALAALAERVDAARKPRARAA